MKSLQWMTFAWLNTWRNRRRSLITMAIAALGTAGILLAGGFALYTYEGLAQASARTTGHLVIATSAQFDGDEDVPMQNGLDGAPELTRQLLADPDVRQVLPRVDFSGLISNGDKSTVMMATGIDPDAEFGIKGPFLTVKAGTVLSNEHRQSVMLGEGLARSLKASPGSSLTLLASTTDGVLNAMDVTVQGIFTTGIPEMDQRLVYTDLATAQQLLVTQRVSSLGVFLDRMEATMPAQERLSTLRSDLTVRNWIDQAPFYRSVRELYNRIFGALGLIITVIVVFVVTNAMAMAIVERTREIGTLRAMGTQPGQIILTFALEGLLLGGLGALLGALMALAVSAGLLIFPVDMPPPPGRSVGYPLQVSLDLGQYLITSGIMTALAALASALVARRAVRQSIVAALAHA